MELACATHPTIETRLACGRCGRAVCVKCMLATEVGTRCRTCSPAAPMRLGRPVAVDHLPGWMRPVAAGAALVCAAALVYSSIAGDRDQLVIRAIVYGGMVASLVAHEFAHSIVAYWGGDREIKARGYLTLNPFKFMDPMLSLWLPLLFTIMGGIPLIGGRTMVSRTALRSRWWDTAVSLAGPGANAAIALVIAAVLRNGIVDPYSPAGAGLAFLALLEVVTVVFNLLPVPPLDGFGAIAPHMDPMTRSRWESIGWGGYMMVLMAFWVVPGLGAWFWAQSFDIATSIGVDPVMSSIGQYYARLVRW